MINRHQQFQIRAPKCRTKLHQNHRHQNLSSSAPKISSAAPKKLWYFFIWNREPSKHYSPFTARSKIFVKTKKHWMKNGSGIKLLLNDDWAAWQLSIFVLILMKHWVSNFCKEATWNGIHSFIFACFLFVRCNPAIKRWFRHFSLNATVQPLMARDKMLAKHFYRMDNCIRWST